MEPMVTKGVFTGSVNGSELNIVSTTTVTDEKVTIECERTNGKKRVEDEFTDPDDVRLLWYVEQRKASLSAAEAYRNRPVTPNWKPERPTAPAAPELESSTMCVDCEGIGEIEGNQCRACMGAGWR